MALKTSGGNNDIASEVRSDLIIELSDLKYPDMYVHIVYDSHFGGLWRHGGLHTASEVNSDFRIKLSDLGSTISVSL